MNTADLPVLPKSNRDVYKSVIDSVDTILVDELYWLYFIGNGMVDPIFNPIIAILGMIEQTTP
jgi:hypothetical protein